MSASASDERPTRATRRLLRFVWRWRMPLLLVVVLIGGGYEWYNKSSYDRTRQAIQARVKWGAFQKRSQLKLADVEPLIYGIPFRQTGREKGNNVVNLAWCGLVTSYPLQLQLDQDGWVLGAYEIPPAAIHEEIYSEKSVNKPMFHERGLPPTVSNVVCLGKPQFVVGLDQGILLRELSRQALLIAARDELGLGTRDPVLRETIPEEPGATHWPISVMVTRARRENVLVGPTQVQVIELNPRALKPLGSFELKEAEATSIEGMTTRAESLSRNEFVKILETSGYKRQGVASQSQAEIPQPIQQLQKQLNCLPQFAALRSLHVEIRKSGESAALLDGLAQGYAILGTLCERHWSPAHKVFKARGLLYAERLLAKYPRASAYRTRAFVRALVGLHAAALTDLQTAAKEGSDPDTDRTAVLDAFCSGRYAALNADFQNPQARKLARYLQYFIAELTAKREDERTAASRLLELEPDCLRVIIPPLYATDRSIIEQALSHSRRALAQSVFHNLPALPGLRENLRKLLRDPSELETQRTLQVQLLQNLKDSGRMGQDDHEPSLDAASELIRDMQFTQAWRDTAYLHGEDYVYGKPDDNLVTAQRQAVAPLLAGHPFAGFLDCFQWRHDKVQEAISQLMQSVADKDIEATMSPVFGMATQYRAGGYPQIEKQCVAHGDAVYRDFIFSMEKITEKDSIARLKQQIYDVCPQAPLCLAYFVTHDWDHVSEKAVQWEKDHSDAPPLMHAIAEQYYKRKQWRDAERCFKLIIEDSHDQAAYKRLADLYFDTGNDDGLMQTWEEALTFPGNEQDRINARSGLVWHYRRVKNFSAACRHVDAIMEDYRAYSTLWTLNLAADCYEAAGDWNKSNEYRQHAAHLNESTWQNQVSSFAWHSWCRRTGRGDLAAARELVRPMVARLESNDSTDDRSRVAVYYYCEDELEKSLEHFRWAFYANQDPYWGIQSALIADELGNAELRDSMLSDTLRVAVRQNHSLIDLIHDLRNASASPPVPINLKVAEWRLRVLSQGQPTNHWYYLGKFLVLRGNVEDGHRLLKLAAGSIASDLYTTTMAGVSLVRDGVRSPSIRAVELDDEQPRIAHLLRTAYDHLMKKEYDKARDFIDRALERDPLALSPVYLRGWLAEELKMYPEAIADYSKCLEQVPESVDMLCRRARCEEQLKDYAASIRDYERALELDPHYGTPQVALAMIHASCADSNQRDAAKALKLAQAGYTAERLPTWIRDHALAVASAAAGDFENAVKYGLEAVKRCPAEQRKITQDCLDLYRQGKVYVQKLEK